MGTGETPCTKEVGGARLKVTVPSGVRSSLWGSGKGERNHKHRNFRQLLGKIPNPRNSLFLL